MQVGTKQYTKGGYETPYHLSPYVEVEGSKLPLDFNSGTNLSPYTLDIGYGSKVQDGKVLGMQACSIEWVGLH